MSRSALKYSRFVPILICAFLLPIELWAGEPSPQPPGQRPTVAQQLAAENQDILSDLDVYVKGPNGTPLEGLAVVIVTKLNGEVYDQKTAKDGYVRFNGMPRSEYTVQVVAPAYQKTVKQLDLQGGSLLKFTIEMKPLSDAEDAASSVGIAALSPKAQREVGKALEALRVNKPNDARSHLEA